MGHKYLDNINVKLENTPYGYCEGTGRDTFWKKQREEYGFDERETWSLDYTFVYWLYERISMYNEINIVDTKNVIINSKTMQDNIDELLSYCKEIISNKKLSIVEQDELFDKILTIFNGIIKYLWW